MTKLCRGVPSPWPWPLADAEETVPSVRVTRATRACLHSPCPEDGGDEVDEGGEAVVGLLIARGNASKGFYAAEEVFDEMPPLVFFLVMFGISAGPLAERNDGRPDPKTPSSGQHPRRVHDRGADGPPKRKPLIWRKGSVAAIRSGMTKQHGHGWTGFSVAASVAVALSAGCWFFTVCTGVATAISSRARAMVLAWISQTIGASGPRI
jgi:hypothetical protein